MLGTLTNVQTYLHRQFLVRLGVVILVLAASAYVGSEPSRAYIRNILTVGAILLVMREIKWGLPLMVLVSLAVPFSIGTGTQTRVGAGIVLLALLFGVWVMRLVRKHDRHTISSRTLLPLVAFVLVTMVAFGVGQLGWFNFGRTASLAAQLGGLGIFILSAIAFLLVAHQATDLVWLKYMVVVLVVVGAVYRISLFMPWLRLGFYFTSSMSGSLFWVWLVALAFSQAVFNNKLAPIWRLLLLFLVGFVMFRLFFATRDWTSGWLPATIAIGAVVVPALPRMRSRFFQAASILVSLAVLLNIETIYRQFVLRSNTYSLLTRLRAVDVLVEIIKVSPIFGLGPSNYYWYTPLFPILGWYVRFNSHNQYVDIVAQSGLLGLFFFLWFFAEMALLAWRLRDKVPEGFARAYVFGAFGGIFGTLAAGVLGDWILPFVYNIGVGGFQASAIGWLFMGGLVAIEQMSRRGQFEPVQQPVEV